MGFFSAFAVTPLLLATRPDSEKLSPQLLSVAATLHERLEHLRSFSFTQIVQAETIRFQTALKFSSVFVP